MFNRPKLASYVAADYTPIQSNVKLSSFEYHQQTSINNPSIHQKQSTQGWQEKEKVEKNMFVTPVFYLGAVRNRFNIALQYGSCKLVNLFPRGLPGKLGLIGIFVARGCLKHLFLSESSQTTL